ncbi:MAG TPA: cation diffusion facilitator family transporter [Actinomycetales bacterium]|nr:cation diffusion facilitator family transporter [Actinomycetales bacterium]
MRSQRPPGRAADDPRALDPHDVEVDAAGTAAEPEAPGGGPESTGTVLIAMGANAGIAVAKGVAAVLSGSAAMAAETAHSIVDTVNEVLLLVALRRSDQPADRHRPFGYGTERFFWSFLAAVSIFVSGAVFAAIEGVRTLLSSGEEIRSLTLSYTVLGIAFVLEGTSWLRATQQIRQEAKEHERTLRHHLRFTDDPTVKTVFYEDSAALIGLVLAFLGIWVHHQTGSSVGDGVASLLIALLLTVAAGLLARTGKDLLVGTQADPRLIRALVRWLSQRPEVDGVVDLLTERIGTDRVLVCARIDFVDDATSSDVEQAIVEMDRALRDRFTDVVEVFLEVVPRNDPELRQRVRDRYGESVAQRLQGFVRDGE